jgi:hypothetical protein
MSATLTWFNSGLGTKTGTAVGNFFTDFKTLIDSKAGDANFTWEVAASSLASTPYYLWLRPKGGANGRILLISWTSAPAGNNAVILDTAPTTSATYVCYFPNGNAASPSNLTASSGSISGDDTNAVKVACYGTTATLYGASIQPFYFDSAEGVYFCLQNPASTALYMCGAGELFVDGADNSWGASVGVNTGSWGGWSASTSICTYASSGITAGSASVGYKSNYASQASPITWYHAFTPSGNWGSFAVGPNDILTDTTNSKAYFVPMTLVASNIKGGGFPLKFRQLAIGPATTGSFSVYNTTGPVVSARCANAATAGGNGYPWFVNFKI